jgi:hypothetical protein
VQFALNSEKKKVSALMVYALVVYDGAVGRSKKVKTHE